ncbi:hypothetical protein [Leifsonia sp. AG29]|uniref:hypothetical protein n=1 Tax=Leifsonia sp. AG29 TaxID=2598860 RepID=UPI00131BD7C2|nr:hypothetical protein [Leifsonia sp. AG29]
MSRIRTAGLVASGASIVLALSGCSVVSAFTPHVQSGIYDTAKEFRAADQKAFGSPSFVPDDATIVRVDWDTQAGTAILTYSSKTHFVTGTCTAPAPVPKAPLADSWWPVDGFPAQGVQCPGGWTAFLIGDQVYAAKGSASS